MFKKAQAAMEFLMTYGWAILVVLVVIGALAYFGVLNPSAFVPERCVLTLPLDCRAASADEVGVGVDSVQLVVRNVGARDLTVTGLLVTGDKAGNVACTLSGGTPVSIQSGTQATVTADAGGCELGTNVVANDKEKLTARVEYTFDDASAVTNAMLGEIITTIQ